ncbi:hypothetical protein BASA50_002410 [Batrachochytrium salamandrivorans]|uniref:Sacsin/Nov domain-containing protein n=1 Tax=Batrachochytrium salamandrivorans TaxID=1357716 RepID=A0ABQ8FLE2_9FUNG|nr:hypothetical protein BASA60_008758 [Batrachochytrium salamandrivorans]KAH6590593.1 hypothetical protein BASA61_005222 [Batrachochytrium salamandrivorans]KAH6600287.1 hypothetical protein BASA50_002410 [Batrachochytrium salamandrivorans]KAH9249326.1 hypothetical protein BASA81_012944 [Batrachochytrium salamandrivorans]
MAGNLALLKQSLLLDTETEAKNVLVNQRHLIDKILARYSAEFTVFRELLQNSNDAGAESAQIIFLTDSDAIPKTSLFSFPWSKTSTVHTVVYKNNGRAFSDQDFARLRKIAEGNPDEQKIGFFGVGFYSLFSLCEEPFVTSGSQSMAFLWKNDMLFTKHGKLPEEAVSDWTTFYLAMREPIDPPNASNFGRFLTTSLAFTTCLKSVQVFVDSECILNFDKKGSIPRPINIPDRRSMQLSSPNNLFQLSSVSVAKVQLDAQVKGRRSTDSYTIFMHIATADITTSLPRKLSDEMKRTTKKNPPALTQLLLMFSNFDEYDSSSGVRKGVDMFDDLIPGPADQGRIFIGFPTHQTTGCAVQVAGHLIPTVERESIDFVDRSLSYWNQELLYMGGLLSRIVYDDDIGAIDTLYNQLSLDTQSQEWLEKKAVHTMAAFTFKLSTPSPHVSTIMQKAFNATTKQPMRIVSTKGIHSVKNIRLPVPDMLPFIKLTPLLPDTAAKSCPDLIRQLQSGGYLSQLGLVDVFSEVHQRPFTTVETVALLKWWAGQLQASHMYGVQNSSICISRTDSIALKKALVLQDSPDSDRIPLSKFTHFVRSDLGAADLPFPETVMPCFLTKYLPYETISAVFIELQEYTIVDWTHFIVTHPGFGVDTVFTERCMTVISRHHRSSSETVRALLASVLILKPCIVTQTGSVMVANQVYFSNVTLFKGLPIVGFVNPRAVSEAMLKSLGVREHVDLQVVFDRLTDLNWDQVQLIKYLASVQTKLSGQELSRLKVTPIFLSESTGDASVALDPNTVQPRYRACDLFTPIDSLRSLGLVLLQWTGRWRPESLEARFMRELGLVQHVPIDNLIHNTASASSTESRMAWLQYFISNYSTIYNLVYRPESITTPFLPIIGSTSLAIPTMCFSDPTVAIVGFNVLNSELKMHAEILGVKPAPPAQFLVDQLRRSPPSLETAQAVFTFFGTQQAFFTNSHWTTLRTLLFIPTVSPQATLDQRTGSTTVKYASPTTVYFKGLKSDNQRLTPFLYIDFGASANAFLRTCGVKDEPSPLELAQSLVKSPNDFLESCGINEYLSLLHQIAANYESLKRDRGLVSLMRSSAFLLGSRHGDQSSTGNSDTRAATTDGSAEKVADSDSLVVFKLSKASEIYLMDDAVSSQIFRPLCAPMEEILEQMYLDLGSSWISKKVQLNYSAKGTLASTNTSQKLQSLINERAVLLLYDGHQTRRSRDLAPNAEKILTSLKVFETRTIDIVRTFEGVSRTQRTTSCKVSPSSLRNTDPVLVITSDFDYFDVSSIVGSLILRKPRLDDNLMLSMLLSSSIENLNRKGFPVDRILNQRAIKLKLPTKAVVESSPRGSNSTLSRNGNTNGSDLQATLNGRGQMDQNVAVANEAEREDAMEQVRRLLSIFPDADPQFLLSRLQALGLNSLEQIVSEMADNGYPQAKAQPGVDDSENGSNETESLIPRQSQTSDGRGQKRGSSQNDSGLFGMLNKFTGMNMNLPKDFGGHIGKLANTLSQSSRFPASVFSNDGPLNVAHAPTTDITPRQTETLKSQLQKSISTARQERNSSFQTVVPNDRTPESTITRLQSQCNILTEQDLVFLMHTQATRIPVYIDRAAAETMSSPQTPLAEHAEAIHRFSLVLDFLSRVFKLQGGVVHMYWDRDGATIAFNRGRALFFNLRFYVGLHFQAGRDVVSTAPGAFPTSATLNPPLEFGTSIVNEPCSVLTYWFMKFCHELAHNFVGEHNSVHEYWMSSFAETYFESLVFAMQQAQIDLVSAV